MSGTRSVWTDGQAVTTPDLQRSADAAAVADDLVFSALLPAPGGGGVGKRILSLSSGDEPGGWSQVLVNPGSGGTLSVYAALYEVGLLVGSEYSIALAARAPTGIQTVATIAANSTGFSRTDLLYAVVQRSATPGASRKVKTVTSAVITSTLVVETNPTVTFVIATGTTSAPADSTSAWNFPLATITVPTGYVEGTTILSSQIAQIWTRAFVPASAVRSVFGATFGAGLPGILQPVAPEPSWKCFGAASEYVVPFRHIANGAGAVILADRLAIWWKNRIVRFMMVRAVAHSGEYPAPGAVTLPGSSVSDGSGWVYTGTTNGTLWTSANGFVLAINNNYLTLSKPAGAAPSDAAGDHWLLIVETMDQFL